MRVLYSWTNFRQATPRYGVTRLDPRVGRGWIVDFDMFRWYVVLALLLSACAPQPVYTPPEPMRWPAGAYPIELRVSSALDPCQAASADAAVVWLESRVGRDLFTPVTVSPNDPALLGIPIEGVISLAPSIALGRPHHLGEARRDVYGGTQRLYYVNVEIIGCSPWVMSHELGHALGLEHVGDPDALMYPVALGGWSLSEEEIALLGL